MRKLRLRTFGNTLRITQIMTGIASSSFPSIHVASPSVLHYLSLMYLDLADLPGNCGSLAAEHLGVKNEDSLQCISGYSSLFSKTE